MTGRQRFGGLDHINVNWELSRFPLSDRQTLTVENYTLMDDDWLSD